MLRVPSDYDVGDFSAELRAQIKAATEWFYRTRIKFPRDTCATIAREIGEPEAAVQAWIDEAERLLNLGGTILR